MSGSHERVALTHNQTKLKHFLVNKFSPASSTGALIISQVIHPLSTNSGGSGKVVRAPANKSGAAEVLRAAPQSHAQQRQTAGPHPTGHQERRPPKQNDYYGPREARKEVSPSDRCDGCEKLGHPAAKYRQWNHPNWNTQYMTIRFKDSAIGRANKLRANGIMRSLPPTGIEWIPAMTSGPGENC
jgi:hypothetical protein